MEPDRLSEARTRVKKKKEFYKHLTSYLVMGVFFFVLNALTSFGSWWFYWPLLGWGIGIGFHYMDVFGFPGVGNLSDEWEEQAIQEEMQRMRGERSGRSAIETPAEEELELRNLEKEKQRRKNWDESDLV